MPSKLLDEFISKHLGTNCVVTKRVNMLPRSQGGFAVGFISITQAGSVFGEWEAPWCTKKKLEAIEMASAYSLFRMLKQLNLLESFSNVEDLLPGPHRTMFRKWREEAEQDKLKEFQAKTRPRVEKCTAWSEGLKEVNSSTALQNSNSGTNTPTENVETTQSLVPSFTNFGLSKNALASSLAQTSKEKAEEIVVAGDEEIGVGNLDEITVADKKGSKKSPADIDSKNKNSESSDKSDSKLADPTSKLLARHEHDLHIKQWHNENQKRLKFLDQRNDLPVRQARDEIIEMVNSNVVSIVSGSTGSGKTTQVPQYCLEHAIRGLPERISEERLRQIETQVKNQTNNVNPSGSSEKESAQTTQAHADDLVTHAMVDGDLLPTIIVTEPRRISAVSVGTRVAEEMGDKPGKGAVGYQIRLEKLAHPKYCRLLFCTIGVLLQRMKGDPDLRGVTHVFLDEVHERSAESDLALLLLKRKLLGGNTNGNGTNSSSGTTPRLKLCLMSATADESKLSAYFQSLPTIDDASLYTSSLYKQAALTTSYSMNSRKTGLDHVPHIAVPGRIFPVQEFYLEDVVEITGFREQEDEWGERFGANMSSVTTKALGGKSETHVSYWDDDAKTAQWIELPYNPKDYCNDTLETLTVMNQTRINYDLIVETLAVIEKSFTEFEKSSSTRSGMPGDVRKRMAGNLGSSNRGGNASAHVYVDDDDDNDDINNFIHGNDENDAEFEKKKPSRSDGAVLIFLPGMPEINRTQQALNAHPFFGDTSQNLVVPLHSVLTSQDQKQAFEKPRKGVRKIVLSTNIAETGVTIPDVVFVIDSGKVKQQQFDEPSATSSLREVFVSQAEATQRRGRAGRVRSGFCFRLYTQKRFDQKFLKSPIPELLRCSLTELMLSVLMANLQPSIFQDALDAPPPARVHHSLQLLQDVGCCEVVTIETGGIAGQGSIAKSKDEKSDTSGTTPNASGTTSEIASTADGDEFEESDDGEDEGNNQTNSRSQMVVGRKIAGNQGGNSDDSDEDWEDDRITSSNANPSFNPPARAGAAAGRLPKLTTSQMYTTPKTITKYVVTPLGKALATLPVDIRMGKMLILSQLFGGSDTVLNAVSALSNGKSCFAEPADERKKELAKRKQILYYEKMEGRGVLSDHIAAAEAVREYLGVQAESDRWNLCKQYWLSKQALVQISDIKDDLMGKLRDNFETGYQVIDGSEVVSSNNNKQGKGGDKASSTSTSADKDSDKASASGPSASGPNQPKTLRLTTMTDSRSEKQEFNTLKAFRDRPLFAACLVSAGLRPNIARVDMWGQNSYHNVGGQTAAGGAGGNYNNQKNKNSLGNYSSSGNNNSSTASNGVISVGSDMNMRLRGSFVKLPDVNQTTQSGAVTSLNAIAGKSGADGGDGPGGLNASGNKMMYRWLSYHTKMKTSTSKGIAFIRDATAITNPLWLILFHTEDFDIIGSKRCIIFNSHRGVPAVKGVNAANTVGGNTFRDWQCITLEPRAAALLRQLKTRFQLVMKKWLLLCDWKRQNRNNGGNKNGNWKNKNVVETDDSNAGDDSTDSKAVKRPDALTLTDYKTLELVRKLVEAKI